MATWVDELKRRPTPDLSLETYQNRLVDRYRPDYVFLAESDEIVAAATAAEKSSMLDVTRFAEDDEGWITVLPSARMAAQTSTQQIIAANQRKKQVKHEVGWQAHESREIKALRRNLSRLKAPKQTMDMFDDEFQDL